MRRIPLEGGGWLVRNDVEPDSGMVGIAAIMEALDVAEI